MRTIKPATASNYLNIPDEKLQFDHTIGGAHQIITDYIRPESTVLDVGCSSGYLAKELLKKKVITDGIDIDRNFLRTAKKYCRFVYRRDLYSGRLDIPRKRYDFIICADILEHLPRPDLILARLRSYVKKRGELIISIPNIGRIEHRISQLFGSFEYSYGIMSHDHLRFYTKKSAEYMIRHSGYHIQRYLPTGFAQRIPIRTFDTLLAFQFIFICQTA